MIRNCHVRVASRVSCLCVFMDENTPRRSSRVSGRKEADPGNVGVGPVSSFRTNWKFKWPHSSLKSDEVEDLDEAVRLVDGKNVLYFYGSMTMYTEIPPRKDFNFKLGDAVLVRTGTNPSPSVAIIVSMWQESSSTSSLLRGEDGLPRIFVHWFVKPNELPSVRRSRHHEAVRSSYSNCSRGNN